MDKFSEKRSSKEQRRVVKPNIHMSQFRDFVLTGCPFPIFTTGSKPSFTYDFFQTRTPNTSKFTRPKIQVDFYTYC